MRVEDLHDLAIVRHVNTRAHEIYRAALDTPRHLLVASTTQPVRGSDAVLNLTARADTPEQHVPLVVLLVNETLTMLPAGGSRQIKACGPNAAEAARLFENREGFKVVAQYRKYDDQRQCEYERRIESNAYQQIKDLEDASVIVSIRRE